MLRLVRHGVPSPRFWLLCDNNQCGAVAEGHVDATTSAEDQQKFLQKANAAGWSINLLGQLCPHHTAELRQRLTQMQADADEQAVKQLIQVAKVVPPNLKAVVTNGPTNSR
jgi:hypothetical protein